MTYSLQIVSRMPQFDGKVFRSYRLNGQDCIGVWGDEEFELRFNNNSRNKVQVRLSVDGTDIATGNKAHTGSSTDGMWAVEPYNSLNLRAWVETSRKGRHFIFASPGKEVARYTHGDLSNKGIIAAAVFVEGEPPVQLIERKTTIGRRAVDRRELPMGRAVPCAAGASLDYDEIAETYEYEPVKSLAKSRSTPGVGAGREVFQKVGTAIGLSKPVLSEILNVKYMWWDDLVEQLVAHGYVHEDTASMGFPGDREKRFMDLSHVPMAGTSPQVGSFPGVIQRFTL